MGRTQRRHVDTEMDLYVQVKMWENRVFVWAGYSHFWTGEYVRSTGKSEDMDWASRTWSSTSERGARG